MLSIRQPLDSFEYLVKLLTMHSSRLEQEGARVLAVPSWREPGQHFVSGLAFLDFTHKKDRKHPLGVMEHARRALDSIVHNDRQVKHEYYRPEVLLLYYYGMKSPIVSALHNVTHVQDISMQLDLAQNDTLTRKPFMEAYDSIHNFILETSNITLWAVSEKLDESFLLMAQHAGLQRLYEEETRLPLWDTIPTNTNPKRQRDSVQENIVAGIGRTIMSPGASMVHPLVLESHTSWWKTLAMLELETHLTAIGQARKHSKGGVLPDEIQEKRKQYNMFLQKERFPRPTKGGEEGGGGAKVVVS